jgi:hypothetical protein
MSKMAVQFDPALNGVVVLGIDPGLSGGVALVTAINGVPILAASTRMPTWHVGTKTIVDVAALERWIVGARREHGLPLPTAAVIEAVHAMPGQGVTSMFAFGRALGAVEA